MAHLRRSKIISAPRDMVFAHVSDFNNLPLWLQPDIEVELSEPVPQMTKGVEYPMKMSRYGISCHCLFRIEAFEPGYSFTDRQLKGVFSSWLHVQRVDEHDENTSLLVDVIEYSLPFGIVGRLTEDLFMRFDLIQLIEQRYRRIEAALNFA